jgi:hypothetical protein
LDKEKGLVMHVSLSEEGQKQAMETAKRLQLAMDELRQNFIKACDSLQKFMHEGGHNITPHTDKAPSGSYVWDTRPIVQMTRSHMKVNPKPRMMDASKSIRYDMLKPCPVQDELIDWLKERMQNGND